LLICHTSVGRAEVPRGGPQRLFQFSQSFSDRFTGQYNVHLHFLHVQFHESNDVWIILPLFALAGKHGTLSLALEESRNDTTMHPDKSVQY
jgi:hypothetical protein